MIAPIGEWVLRTRLPRSRELAERRHRRREHLAVQFASPQSGHDDRRRWRKSGLDPRRLELEITESVMLDARGNALSMLQTCAPSACGWRWTISAPAIRRLSYLRSFPFDKIKIDRSFVADFGDDRTARRSFARSPVSGAASASAPWRKASKPRSSSTGSRADGCTEVQGYLISRPLPPERIADFMTSPLSGSRRFDAIRRRTP